MILIGELRAADEFFRLLDAVAAGKEVVILREGKPVARLIASSETPADTPRDDP